jgi:GNAT superfamily N-acetyltransferase
VSTDAGKHTYLRSAAPDDVSAIVTLVNSAFEVERFFKDGDRTNADQVKQMMAEGTFLLLSDGDSLLACVYVTLNGERAYIGLLAVEPAGQKKGIGKRMMREAESYARAAGSKFADLRTVDLRTELLPIYRSLGYVETGTESADVIPNLKLPVHFVRMSKTL